MLRWPLVLFDLDGVLIDSRSNMQAAWEEVCRQCRLDIPFARYFAGIGLPFREILHGLGLSDRLEEAEHIYAEASIAHFERITLYPGVPAMLAGVRAAGSLTGLVTSKDARRTALLVERFRLGFNVIRPPAPGLRGKPAPDQLLAAAGDLDVGANQAIYVGDMPVDALSARNAGMAYAHADWGYAAGEARFAQVPDIRLPSPDDLLAALACPPPRRRNRGRRCGT